MCARVRMYVDVYTYNRTMNVTATHEVRVLYCARKSRTMHLHLRNKMSACVRVWVILGELWHLKHDAGTCLPLASN